MQDNDLYKTVDGSTCVVRAGERVLPIKHQRGRQYVNFRGKQVHVKDIPDDATRKLLASLETVEGWQALYEI
jgi:hypothetical protein